jgi:hypothetical protein
VRNNPGDDDGGPDAPPACTDGAVESCYTGTPGTAGVGPCHGGMHTCVNGTWGACDGELVPIGEVCGDGIDNNCNSRVDEDEDLDGDGYSTCQNDCCDSTECVNPELVNPGAYDAAGNLLDDDCDGTADNGAALCDTGIASDTTDPVDFARAIDICQTATATDGKWGLLSATFSLANGSGAPNVKSHAVRPGFGTGATALVGSSVALLSTGAAAATNDTNPAYRDFEPGLDAGKSSAFPADFLAANNGKLPNAPGCANPLGTKANDPIMLTLTIRAPTNARSFKLSTNFFSSEFPEYTCTPFNDFFVVLLDSTYAGTPANPTDKNLAFFTPVGSTMKYPVGVNLAAGNTGLFTQCVNGDIGCADIGEDHGSIATCTATTQLAGTGLDNPATGIGRCNNNSLKGGATGWLETRGNVVGGETITLRIAIWDTSDHELDSLAIIDGFEWSVDTAEPGTVIN